MEPLKKCDTFLMFKQQRFSTLAAHQGNLENLKQNTQTHTQPCLGPSLEIGLAVMGAEHLYFLCAELRITADLITRKGLHF